MSARASPPIAGHSSGHVADLAEDDAARGASPSLSTCSPIASRGSISASAAAPSASIFELLEQLVERLFELPFGAIVGKVGDRLAAMNRVDRRDRLDAELRRDQFVLVDVDLGELDALGRIIGRNFLEDRTKLLAWAAPFRPEIEHDERGHRGWMTCSSKRWIASRSASVRPRVAMGYARPFNCPDSRSYGRVRRLPQA
jgi:hypothetical protein